MLGLYSTFWQYSVGTAQLGHALCEGLSIWRPQASYRSSLHGAHQWAYPCRVLFMKALHQCFVKLLEPSNWVFNGFIYLLFLFFLLFFLFSRFFSNVWTFQIHEQFWNAWTFSISQTFLKFVSIFLVCKLFLIHNYFLFSYTFFFDFVNFFSIMWII